MFVSLTAGKDNKSFPFQVTKAAIPRRAACHIGGRFDVRTALIGGAMQTPQRKPVKMCGAALAACTDVTACTLLVESNLPPGSLCTVLVSDWCDTNWPDAIIYSESPVLLPRRSSEGH